MLFKRVASYSGGNSEINELMVFDIFTIIGLDDWCHNIMKETDFFLFLPQEIAEESDTLGRRNSDYTYKLFRF